MYEALFCLNMIKLNKILLHLHDSLILTGHRMGLFVDPLCPFKILRLM